MCVRSKSLGNYINAYHHDELMKSNNVNEYVHVVGFLTCCRYVASHVKQGLRISVVLVT